MVDIVITTNPESTVETIETVEETTSSEDTPELAEVVAEEIQEQVSEQLEEREESERWDALLENQSQLAANLEILKTQAQQQSETIALLAVSLETLASTLIQPASTPEIQQTAERTIEEPAPEERNPVPNPAASEPEPPRRRKLRRI